MPAEVGRRRARHILDAAWHQVDGAAQVGVEDAHVEQTAPGTGGQLTSRLLLLAEAFDLLEVTDGRAPGPLHTAGDQHQRRRPEVVKEAGALVEIGGEEVDAVVVDAQLELGEVLLPLLAHLRPAAADIESGDRLLGPADRRSAQIELAGGQQPHPLQSGDRGLGVDVEGPDLIDLVAEPLRPPGAAAIQAKDVDDAAAHGHLAGRGHRGHPPVPEVNKALDDRVAADPGTPTDFVGAVERGDGEGGPEQPGRGGDHQRRPAVAKQGEGGDPAADDLLRRGDAVKAGGVRGRPEAQPRLATPETGVGIDGLRVGRDHQHVPGGAPAGPPGDQPDGGRGDPAEDAQGAVDERGQGGDGVQAGGQRGRAAGRWLNHRVTAPQVSPVRAEVTAPRAPPVQAGEGGCTRSWPAPGPRARWRPPRRRRDRGWRAAAAAPRA